MKQTHLKLLKGLGIAALFAGSNLALAESVTIPATVTVNNAINFTSTGSLDFGQVRATASTTAANCVGLVLPTASLTMVAASTGTQFAAACTAAGTAKLQAVGGTPARPTLSVTGVAPFTALSLTVPAAAVNLTAATGPGTAQFQLVDFVARKTSGTAADLTAGAGNLATDATGAATVTIGATLITDPAAPTTATYQDLAYSGTFDVTVTY